MIIDKYAEKDEHDKPKVDQSGGVMFGDNAAKANQEFSELLAIKVDLQMEPEKLSPADAPDGITVEEIDILRALKFMD